MLRSLLVLSLLLNALLLGGLAYLLAYDPVVATVTTPTGKVRTVLAGVVNRELAVRYGEEVQGDLVGRALIDLAGEESNLDLDQSELEARWQEWLGEPGVRARIDSGETTESDLKARLVTLVLLDQVSWNDLSLKEQEQEMKEFFASHSRDFEQLHLRHILVESKSDADDVAARLAAGVDFAELTKRFSLDPLTRDQGGDLGWKKRMDLAEDLRGFLFLLPVGAASSPISSSSGWHIFLVEERRSTYQECKEQVRREWSRQRRPETLDALRRRFTVKRSEMEQLLHQLKRPGYFQGSQSANFQIDASPAPLMRDRLDSEPGKS